MDTKTRETIGKKIFNAIKKEITGIKKWNKENTGRYAPRVQVADLLVGMKHGWEGAKDDCYQIRLGYQWYDAPVLADKLTTLYDLKEVIGEVEKHINAQKKVKGWTTLNVAYDTCEFGSGVWNRTQIKYPSKITLCDAPCKEYTALQNFINKYGKTTYWGSTYGAVNLRNFELFCSAMGGKRGRLWDEYGDRRYLDNKPKKCVELLETLRNARGSKDVMLCERGTEDYIDPVDKAYSERHEIECEGEKRSYLKITIKTPTGKVKYETKLY